MRRSNRGTFGALSGACISAWVVYVGCGCGGESHFDARDAKNVAVRPVTLYGMVLDASATPETVAFAALLAVREDLGAASMSERSQAIASQFDLAAINLIAERNRTKLDNHKFVYDVVTHWTPTISNYAADFPSSDAEARSRFVRRLETADEVELALALADPGGDPKAQVVMAVWLGRDKGLWRVLHFGFDRKRSLGAAQSHG